MCIDDASMVSAKGFEYQQFQTFQETDILSVDATSVCTPSKSVISDEGRGHLDMSDAEFGVFIGEEPSCKEKATHEIMGEGVEEEVCVVEPAAHESGDGECVMDELMDGVRRHARDPTPWTPPMTVWDACGLHVQWGHHGL